MIVMVIIGVLVTVALPNMSPIFSKDKLRSSTSTVTSAFYMARTKAVNEGTPYGVRFDENGMVSVVSDPKGTPSVHGAPGRLEDGIGIVSNTFENGLAIFNEYGQLDRSCLSSGSMTGAVTLSNGSVDSTRVEVTFISGRIRETNP